MTIVFFFWGGGGGEWEKEETDEMAEKKWSCLKPNIRNEYRLDEMPVPPKTLKSTPPPDPTSHTLPHLSGFELGRMLSVTFEK